MKTPLFAIAALLLAGCMPASQHAQDVSAGSAAGDKVTLGTVQREIRVGMSGADDVGFAQHGNHGRASQGNLGVR